MFDQIWKIYLKILKITYDIEKSLPKNTLNKNPATHLSIAKSFIQKSFWMKASYFNFDEKKKVVI